MTRKVNYIIVGQGIAGSALAWELIQRGKTIVVFDQPEQNRSSAVAAGIYNPLTGRIMNLTWMADRIFPCLEEFYGTASKTLRANFLNPLSVYRPFVSKDEKSGWKTKLQKPEMATFISNLHEQPAFTDEVKNPDGGVEANHSGYLDIRLWIRTVREFLIARGAYQSGFFNEASLVFSDSGVKYGDWLAEKVIYCNGLGSLSSRWWKWVPLRQLKGETLEVEIHKELKRIYNRGVYLVPYGMPGRYLAGATYGHPPFLEGTTEGARKELMDKLSNLMAFPVNIVNQGWGIRPTTPDRRPILGGHPVNKSVILFNGLGTKGVSLAPYFAQMLTRWLEASGALMEEVNIERFKSLYSE